MKSSDTRASSLWSHALVIWAVLTFVLTANGMVRELGYANLVPLVVAQAISTAIMVAAIAFGSYRLVRSYPTTNLITWVRVGLLWSGLSLFFEVVMGRTVGNLSWQAMASNYNLFAGRLWLLVLLAFLLAPIFWGRSLRAGSSPVIPPP